MYWSWSVALSAGVGDWERVDAWNSDSVSFLPDNLFDVLEKHT